MYNASTHTLMCSITYAVHFAYLEGQLLLRQLLQDLVLKLDLVAVCGCACTCVCVCVCTRARVCVCVWRGGLQF